MKNIKTILMIFSMVLMYASVDAQSGCPGNNIKVYKGANGCGCHCLKECVTPAELPDYLANGWNTNGCWNCCKFKWWVDASIPKTSFDKVYPNAELDLYAVLIPGLYMLTLETGKSCETKLVSVTN